jgi:hypothetical protein
MQSPIRLTGKQFNPSGASRLHLEAKMSALDPSNFNHDSVDDGMGYNNVQRGRPDDYHSVTNNYSMGMDKVYTGPSIYKGSEHFSCKGGKAYDCGVACKCKAGRQGNGGPPLQVSNYGNRPQHMSSRTNAFRVDSSRIETRGFEGLNESNSRDHLILPYVASSHFGANRGRVNNMSMNAFNRMTNTVLQE